ncbi:MAG: DUF3040 domain-containing protein [Ornithinimicrobium sp.]
MPLSEHEQRVLEQMEHALYAEDPRFASNLKKSTPQGPSRRRALIGVILAVLGLGLVLLGVFLATIWIGGVGFGAMVLGGVLAFSPTKGSAGKPTLSVVGGDGPKAPNGAKKKPKTRGGGSFMQRMEQRWDKRRESD